MGDRLSLRCDFYNIDEETLDTLKNKIQELLKSDDTLESYVYRIYDKEENDE